MDFLLTCIFFFFVSLISDVIYCEEGNILPFGEILSNVSDIANVISSKNEKGESFEPFVESRSRINLKIVPSKKLNITKNDLMFLMSEIRQEIRRQINILEDELEEKERLRTRSSSLLTTSHSTVYSPEEDETKDQELYSMDDSEREETENLLDSLNTLDKEENIVPHQNTSYDVEIGNDKYSEYSQNVNGNGTRFSQRVLRNGTILHGLIDNFVIVLLIFTVSFICIQFLLNFLPTHLRGFLFPFIR
ncbi:hypothetical protein, conserved [Plasmodium gonderi]|uniref:Secreted ookinete protein n=1 Tax=Plasmodium gonderi TaxID=77519 RepID=A0A1Y1JFQ3_PLAGO|nr:hypothetical protein, conserved [Plasmodium gonderi]GAW81369.1 hypothetical protein, conserved [Plasmodium gonderi]